MNQRTTLLTGAIFGGLGVAIGAFGAHALRPLLEAHMRADTFEVAVRYQFYHSFALLVTGLLMTTFPSKQLSRAAVCFAAGIAVFCGSLYILCLTGITVLGAVTPVGGVLFIAGWIYLLVAITKKGL